MTAPAWQTRIVDHGEMPPAALLRNPNNWRRHPQSQRDALGAVMETVGWVQQVIVNRRTGNIVDGHARVELARERGELTIPVVWIDVDEDEERLILASFDSLAAMARTDTAARDALLASLSSSDRLAAALSHFTKDRPKPGKTHPDDVPARPETPRTRRGDLWILGDHRLICGDAVNEADTAALLAGGANEAALVFTDPPYGVSYESDRFAGIRNDALPAASLEPFLKQAFLLMLASTRRGAPAYVWHASSTRDSYAWALKSAGWLEQQYLIWVKPALVLGHADYQWQHEPCFYMAQAGQDAPPFYGERDQTTTWYLESRGEEGPEISVGPGVVVSDGQGRELYIARQAPKDRKVRRVVLEDGERLRLEDDVAASDTWQFSRDAGRAQHPTQKPVALAERAIANSSRPGEIVLDSFLGSGTTLIAAERLGRRCFGLESDPGYCDVIVARWEAFTGQEAVLFEDVSVSPASP